MTKWRCTEDIKLGPIGFVKTKTSDEEVKHRSHVSQIILLDDLTDALTGIGDFSHVFIIYFMHKVTDEERKAVKTYPRGRRDMPLLGIFATRVARRPNPIGLAVVELLEKRGNIIFVRGLDAYDGTPILDIKPYDCWDAIEDVEIPEWWMQLEKERLEKSKSDK